MSVLDSFYNKIIARLGLAQDVTAASLETGEIAYSTDDSVFHVGDSTNTPPRLITDKSSGTFDLSNADQITLPGGLIFQKAHPGQINGVDYSSINSQSGVIVRRGDNKFGSVSVTGTDGTIIVSNGSGVAGNIDISLNLNNTNLLNLISASGFQLTSGSVPPTNPINGQGFYDTDDCILYMRIGSSTSGFWMDISS